MQGSCLEAPQATGGAEMSGEARECRDACNELLPWYLNGTLENGERAGVGAHLQVCPICRRELEELSEIGSALSLYPESAAPDLRPAQKPGKASIPAALAWTLAASVILISMLGVVA